MGDVRDRFIDVRLIAATHQDLRHLIETKVFRSDLYFRISTVPLAIPPLRERQEDIPAIAHSLLLRICSDMARPAAEISPKALERLRSYYWPGNIRELRNVLERALLFADRRSWNRTICPSNPVPSIVRTPTSPTGLWRNWRTSTSPLHSRTKNQNVEKTAKRLGIAKSTLYQKLKTLNLI